MGYALIILGLLPLVFLPDMMGDEEADVSDDDLDHEDSGGPDSLNGDLLDSLGPTEPEEDGSDVLEPVIEDDVPGGGDPVPDAQVLRPIIEDDTDPGDPGNGEDPLLPVDAIDSQSGSHWVRLEEIAGHSYVELEGFRPGVDTFTILLQPGQLDNVSQPVLSPSDDGEDTRLEIGGDLIAVFHGVSDVTEADIAYHETQAGQEIISTVRAWSDS